MTVFLLTYDDAVTTARVFSHETAGEAQDAATALPGGLKGAVLGTADDVSSQITGKGAVLSLVNALLPPGSAPVKRFATSAAGAKRLFALVQKSVTPAPVSVVPDQQVAATSETADIADGAAAASDNSQEDTTMATKTKKAAKKAAKAKKAPTPRKVAPLFIELTGNGKPPADTTCGCYIRSLVMRGDTTNADILKLVAKHYPESTAKGSDISWNRAKLGAAGKKVPAVVKEEKAAE